MPFFSCDGDHAYDQQGPGGGWAGASYEDRTYARRAETSCRLKTERVEECEGRNVIVATPSRFCQDSGSHERVRSSFCPPRWPLVDQANLSSEEVREAPRVCQPDRGEVECDREKCSPERSVRDSVPR